jgi:osmoprotectant transport system permease protein
VSEQLRLLPEYLTAHLQLSLLALGLAVAASLPIGIAVTRRPRLEAGVLGAASVIQTVPALALLAVTVPALASLGGLTARWLGVELRSIGFLPALVALTLYGMLPVLRNGVAGIAGVDPALIEAARGVGMTDGQRLWRVELPLAMPVIVAGLRTAAVWITGTATLSTPVGATSLGNFIFSGLQTRNSSAVLVGCAAAAALALLLDQTIRALEVGVQRRSRRRAALALAVLAALALWAGGAALRAGSARAPVVVGAKTFTEQYVLAEIVAGWLSREVGVATRTVSSLGSTVAFDALRAGEIDFYVDYSGTIWATLMKRGAPPPGGRPALLDEVARFLAEKHGIGLVAPLGFENAYALGMRAAEAERLGVRSLGDLAAVAKRLEIAGDYEFFARAEWAALERSYGLAFAARRSMDSALMYQALAAGEVDVISAFSSDGRIAALGIVLLEDDRAVIPPYDAILLASPRVAAERPDLVTALRGLADRISDDEMRRMNWAVDGAGRAPREVAREFVERERAGS